MRLTRRTKQIKRAMAEKPIGEYRNWTLFIPNKPYHAIHSAVSSVVWGD